MLLPLAGRGGQDGRAFRSLGPRRCSGRVPAAAAAAPRRTQAGEGTVTPATPAGGRRRACGALLRHGARAQ